MTTELTDQQKRDLIGTEHTITGTVAGFHDHGRLARVSVPGGYFALIPTADLTKES